MYHLIHPTDRMLGGHCQSPNVDEFGRRACSTWLQLPWFGNTFRPISRLRHFTTDLSRASDLRP